LNNTLYPKLLLGLGQTLSYRSTIFRGKAYNPQDPQLNRVQQSVIASRESRTRPDRRHSTERQTLPIALDREMGVKPLRHSHPVRLRQQQRTVIDALCDDSRFLMQPQRLDSIRDFPPNCPNSKYQSEDYRKQGTLLRLSHLLRRRQGDLEGRKWGGTLPLWAR
jgi:hypothetical protein